MPAHILDSRFLGDLYGTLEMRAVFDDLALLQRWLDAEVALAEAEAELGLIPAAAAREIAAKARAEKLDHARIKELVDRTVHPIVPVIRALAEACEGGAGEYVHWGATTQDIMDTGSVLQVKQAAGILDDRLADLCGVLADLARRHRDTAMAGRTHGQQALPVTFGFKAAVWLAECLRHRERLAQLEPRVLVGQFAGAAGTLASVSENGLAIQEKMMARLGLDVPVIGWHTARDGIAEFVAWLGLVASTMGKIAQEIVDLQRTELAEVEEPQEEGKVGSSTMPHKRNPMLCEAVVALGKLVRQQVPAALDAMGHSHERSWTCEHVEWSVVPEACVMTDGAVNWTAKVLRGLAVKPERMRANLDALGGLMLSERVMLALGKKIGRQSAHDLVHACARTSVEEVQAFREVLAADARVAKHLPAAQIDALLDPGSYTGLAGAFVDRVLAQAGR